nr:hypothetical protein [Megavirus caiporensis]
MTYYYLLLLIFIYVIKIICYYYKQINMSNQNTTKTFDDPQISNKIIVTFKGSKYDITDFLRRHPGGKQILIDNNGKDIEKLMLEYEHSNNAYRILDKYKIQSD